MNPVQFEPKITTDLQIDWHRHASQGTDPFADLLADRLKQRFETNQQDGNARRPHPASDPVSGRPPRLVLAHTRTLRGEAKEAEDPDARHLPGQMDCSQGETCPEAAEETPTTGDGTGDAEAPTQQGTAEAQMDPEAAVTADQPAQAAIDQTDQTEQTEQIERIAQTGLAEPIEPTGTLVVVTQPTEQQSSDYVPEPEAVAIPLVSLPAESECAAPELTGDATSAPADGPQTDTEVAPEQQAAAVMAEAGLSAVAATLDSSSTAPVVEPEPPSAVTQPTPLPGEPAATEQGPPQTPEPLAPVADLAPPPAPPKLERPAMDIKHRPGAPTHANAGAPDPAPSSAIAPQSAQPHQATLLQPSAGSDSSSMSDPLEQSFPGDGAGQGWALHLAQGAASKRADFVAQLRQHLQNLPAHEQVAVHIQRALREGTGKFSIQLSPAELGRIHVKLEIDEDKRVTAAITVERPSTLELLQRDVKGLERPLHNAGLNMEGGDLSFSLGQNGDQDFAQDWNQSAASAGLGSVLDVQSETEQPGSPATQVMDTAAGVVDLQV